jgi:transposase
LAQRARLILLLADGVAPVNIMAYLDVTRPTVFKWRKRFEQDGVNGLLDRPRPGQPRKLTEKKVKEVLRLTVNYIPREATHWSTRLMAKYADITQYQVREVWKAADLRPHRLKTFKISNDPLFAEKVIDVVGLYMDPPDNAMVLSVDEKTQIQALDHTQPMLPLRPGQIERRTHDYTRHGTASLYAAFDIASGEIMGRVTHRHRAKEFLAFLRQIDKAVPDELDVHLILDNSSTHKTKAVQRWLTARPRFHTHFTPTSASWLNAVEGWFAQLERRALQRGTFTSVAELREAIRQFIKAHNVETAKPFRWTASANAIIAATNRAKQYAAA